MAAALDHPLSDDQAGAFLRRMWEIRAFEEATQRLFTSGLVRGSVGPAPRRRRIAEAAEQLVRAA